MANEPIIQRGSLPQGYAFVPKGNVYITATCRKDTQAAGKTVHLVVEGKDNKQIGLAVPSEIYQDVQQKEVQTRAARSKNVDRRDNAIKNTFEQVVLQEYPRLPRDSLPLILKVALEKGAGKVGRTGTLSDRQKAQLAVRAHIRHCHTDYEKILRDGRHELMLKGGRRDSSGAKAKEMARKTVQIQVNTVAASWGPATRRPSISRSRRPEKSSSLSKSKGRTRTLPLTTATTAQTSAPATRRERREAVRAKKSKVSAKKSKDRTVAAVGTRISRRTRNIPVEREVIDLTMDSDDESGSMKSFINDDSESMKSFSDDESEFMISSSDEEFEW